MLQSISETIFGTTSPSSPQSTNVNMSPRKRAQQAQAQQPQPSESSSKSPGSSSVRAGGEQFHVLPENLKTFHTISELTSTGITSTGFSGLSRTYFGQTNNK